MHVFSNIIQFLENFIKFGTVYSYDMTMIIWILDVQYPKIYRICRMYKP